MLKVSMLVVSGLHLVKKGRSNDNNSNNNDDVNVCLSVLKTTMAVEATAAAATITLRKNRISSGKTALERE